MSEMLEAALVLAARYWSVFPLHSMRNGRCTCGTDCSSPAKHPIFVRGELEHGVKDASRQPALIRDWWRRFPEANIGMSTAGLVVVDIDRPGLPLWDQMQIDWELGETLMARTGSGGLHCIYFPRDAGTTNAKGKLPRGIDVRGSGGYIVAPPSLHKSGQRYRWLNWELMPRILPDALWELIRPPAPARTQRHYVGPEKIEGDPIGEGQRNERLYRIACSMVNRLASPEDVEATLARVNEARCRPPLPEGEVVKIARSAARYLAAG